jgi:hypothetical protein
VGDLQGRPVEVVSGVGVHAALQQDRYDLRRADTVHGGDVQRGEAAAALIVDAAVGLALLVLAHVVCAQRLNAFCVAVPHRHVQGSETIVL